MTVAVKVSALPYVERFVPVVRPTLVIVGTRFVSLKLAGVVMPLAVAETV